MTIVRIIAAVLDTQQLLMYKADGETLIIPQGDPRIRPLVSKVFPELERLTVLKETIPSTQVFIDLTEEEINQAPTFEATQTHYAEAEKKMGGVVKFFRMAKAKLKELVEKVYSGEAEPMEPIGMVGSLPAEPTTVTVIVPAGTPLTPLANGGAGISIPIPVAVKEEEEPEEDNAPLTKSMSAVNEIMANAMPSHSPEFIAGAKDKDTTVVAVMEDGTVIPGMENLDLQLRHTAEKLGNPVGIIKFFQRLATVQRGHSVADLLKFMEKGELPIADDGTILVYKRLMSTRVEGEFVDCHSKKVKQRVGSHVFMDESLVDPNRSRDCSNGLHVARRDYLNSFSGDVTVLAKLAPEDVIAVPHSDARKLRAKGYFIIAQLSSTDAQNVCSNRKLTDTNLLGNAVAGNHTEVIETVQITQGYGGGLIITPVAGNAEVVADSALSASPLKTEEDVLAENSSIDARTVAMDLGTVGTDRTVESTVTVTDGVITDVKISEPVDGEFVAPPGGMVAPKFEAKVEQKLNKVEQLVANFNNATSFNLKLAAAQALVEHKKSTKKSWVALGVPVGVADAAMTHAKATIKPSEVLQPEKPSSKKAAEKTKPSAGTKGKSKSPAVVKLKTAIEKSAQSLPKGKPKNDDKMIKLSKAEQIRKLLSTDLLTIEKAKQIVAIKKAAKKGWEALGVSAAEEKEILRFAK